MKTSHIKPAMYNAKRIGFLSPIKLEVNFMAPFAYYLKDLR